LVGFEGFVFHADACVGELLGTLSSPGACNEAAFH
jgi:hypothetical protein